MWQAILGIASLSWEIYKYLKDQKECKIELGKKSARILQASRDMRAARKGKDAKRVESIFRGLNLDGLQNSDETRDDNVGSKIPDDRS